MSTAAARASTAAALAGRRRYDATALAVSRLVLRRYSTSFGWATRLLARPVRPHIAAVYGLVRLADEIVDGPAEAAGLDVAQRGALLDALEAEAVAATSSGYSANLVVHAFARTARRFGIGPELTAPFFASMRADLTLTSCTPDEFARYVHGSAEVVGLMCLRVFLGDEPLTADRRDRLERGARHLGAAFQKINFLRDLGDDVRGLGRCYFPNVPGGVLDEPRKAEIVTDIRADLRIADAAVRELPVAVRPAVLTAQRLFEALTDRIEATPAHEVIERRIRVPDPVKARIVARAAIEGRHP